MARNSVERERLSQIVEGGFNVTCVVGRVQFSDMGDETAYTVALTLIGKHGTDGHYTFPHENGGTVHVTIETEPLKSETNSDNY